MRGKETLWKQIRTLWTVVLLAVLFVGTVQVKAEGNPEEGTMQGEVQAPTIEVTQYINEAETDWLEETKMGQPYELSVEVPGASGQVSYIWKDELGKVVQIGDSSYVVIKSTGLERYYCEIMIGSETKEVKFDLFPEKTLNWKKWIGGEQIDSKECEIGEKVVLKIEIWSYFENQKLTYSWRDESGKILSTEETCTVVKGIGEEQYTCVIGDGNYDIGVSFTLRGKSLTIKQCINEEETDTWYESEIGKKYTLQVSVGSTYSSDIEYQWYSMNDSSYNVAISGANESSYMITKGMGFEYYKCVVTDGNDSKELFFTLWAEDTVSIVSQKINGETNSYGFYKPGDQLLLEVEGRSSISDSEVTYQWTDASGNDIPGATQNKYEFEKGEGTEVICCEVSDINYSVSTQFTINVSTIEVKQLLINKEPYREDDIYTCTDDAEYILEVQAVREEGVIEYNWYRVEETGGNLWISDADTEKCTVKKPEKTETYFCEMWTEDSENVKCYFVLEPDSITNEDDYEPTTPEEPTTPTTPEEPTKPSNPTTGTKPSTQPFQQTPSAQQPQTPSASASSPAPAIGATLVASDKKTVYKVTGSNTVEYKKAGSNKAKVTIPSTVTYQGRKYQVTSIGTKAFKNNKKLKKVVIPSTVRKIGKQAFINCKKLKSIIIKTNKLNAKAIGSKAFKGINAKATIKVPKKKLKLYKKILRAKGVSASVRIK